MATYASMRKADLIEALIERDATISSMCADRSKGRWDAREFDTRDNLEKAYSALQAALDKAREDLEHANAERKVAENNANTYCTENDELRKAADDSAKLASAAEDVSLSTIDGARVVEIDTSQWYHRITVELDHAGHGHMLTEGTTLALCGLDVADLDHLGALV